MPRLGAPITHPEEMRASVGFRLGNHAAIEAASCPARDATAQGRGPLPHACRPGSIRGSPGAHAHLRSPQASTPALPDTSPEPPTATPFAARRAGSATGGSAQRDQTGQCSAGALAFAIPHCARAAFAGHGRGRSGYSLAHPIRDAGLPHSVRLEVPLYPLTARPPSWP
jgi:hypothetical protein